MKEIKAISQHIEQLLDLIGRDSLSELLFEPIQQKEVEWNLAHLTHLVAPSYLPLARDDSGTLALHLRPKCSLDQSPVVYIQDDYQQARFICKHLALLPVGLWLWVGRYFKEEPETLRRETDAMAASIPNGQAVPEKLWELLESSPSSKPTLWSVTCDVYTEQAWQEANVGHPFVGMPKLKYSTDVTEALPLLEAFCQDHQEPELIAVLIATRRKARKNSDSQDILTVLSSEAWRSLDCIAKGLWRESGDGLCEWDATLRHLEDAGSVLIGSAFEPLIDHPNTYSGTDAKGPLLLAGVSEVFRTWNDLYGALYQLRNAMTVGIQVLGHYPENFALSSADVCNSIEKESLAATIAQASIQIDREKV